MAKPAFMRGKGATLFGDRKDPEAGEHKDKGGAAEHLDALEGLVDTPRARSALNTLRSELVGESDSSKRKTKDTGTKQAAMERFAS